MERGVEGWEERVDPGVDGPEFAFFLITFLITFTTRRTGGFVSAPTSNRKQMQRMQLQSHLSHRVADSKREPTHRASSATQTDSHNAKAQPQKNLKCVLSHHRLLLIDTASHSSRRVTDEPQYRMCQHGEFDPIIEQARRPKKPNDIELFPSLLAHDRSTCISRHTCGRARAHDPEVHPIASPQV